MKKSSVLSAVISSVLVLSCVSLPAAAVTETEAEEKLPFTLEAPTKLSLSWNAGDDSPTTMKLAYSMNDSMCQWLSKAAEPTTHEETMQALEKENQLSDLYVNVQIDWAIDDAEKGWHYTSYWDGETFTDGEGKQQWAGLGHDKDYHSRVSDWDIVDAGIGAKTVNDIWILRGNLIQHDPAWSEEETKEQNPWFYGTEWAPGIKDQLQEGQYTLADVGDNAQELRINVEEHTVYVRARWAVTMVDMDMVSTPVFSEWSASASVGKEGETFEVLKPGDLPAPIISGLRYYPEEFNGYPQVACTLDVPEEVSKKHAEVVAHGGEIRVEWEARVPDGEWIEQQAGGDVTAGENVISLIFLGEALAKDKKDKGEDSSLVLAKGSPIELRARYWCSQSESYLGEAVEPFTSDYSAVLTFASEEMSKTEESVPESSQKVSEEEKPASVQPKTEEKKCGLCGFCPQPLGLCIFIWIAIAVAVVVVVIVVIVIVKKGSKKKNGSENS